MKKVRLEELEVVPVTHNPEIGKQVMLGGDAAPGLTNFSQAVFAPGQVAPGHAHGDMCEVFFVRAGRAVISVDETRHELSTGDCVLVESGERHEVSNPFDEELELLYFGLRDNAGRHSE